MTNRQRSGMDQRTVAEGDDSRMTRVPARIRNSTAGGSSKKIHHYVEHNQQVDNHHCHREDPTTPAVSPHRCQREAHRTHDSNARQKRVFRMRNSHAHQCTHTCCKRFPRQRVTECRSKCMRVCRVKLRATLRASIAGQSIERIPTLTAIHARHAIRRIQCRLVLRSRHVLFL